VKHVLSALIALLLAAASAAAAAQQLGRLFFTPEQRAALDARRKARVPDKPAAVLIESPSTTLDGYVKRSNGKSTVFLNGEPIPTGSANAPRIKPGSVSVPASDAGGARINLKPGEVLDRGTGEVTDVIGKGEIKVERPHSDRR
jgi:predicted small lipoprotein YifL